MSRLAADCRDVASTCGDLGAMFLLSERHMRTETGKALLREVRALSRRALDAEGTIATLRMRDSEFDSQRSVIERMTAEAEAANAELARLRAENERLRAAIATATQEAHEARMTVTHDDHYRARFDEGTGGCAMTTCPKCRRPVALSGRDAVAGHCHASLNWGPSYASECAEVAAAYRRGLVAGVAMVKRHYRTDDFGDHGRINEVRLKEELEREVGR